MSGVCGKVSIIKDRFQNLTFRIYLNDSGTEYYETMLTPEEMIDHCVDGLNKARLAQYYIKTLK